MIEWQPIETAPRDGTAILGFNHHCFVTAWRTLYTTALRGEKASWWDTKYPTGEHMEFQPTHWMPLPKPDDLG